MRHVFSLLNKHLQSREKDLLQELQTIRRTASECKGS